MTGEVPSTPTATDRNAEVIRLNGVIAEATQTLDKINEETRIALIANQTAMENNERFKVEEIQLQKDHDASIERRQAEKDALEGSILTLTGTKTQLETDNKVAAETLATSNTAIEEAEKKLAGITGEIESLKNDNHPLLVAADQRLAEVQEATRKEQTRFDSFIIQRGEFQQEMDIRHAAVIAAEKRINTDQRIGL